ncbi:hypothetical protein J2Z53_002181 [Clostridium moniliforme]|uniref:DUF2508 family protein n=1 Tax=Clostridium moniliforme TaxID=39489 RepID=A0ABS4F2U7_9CLOT|nr:YaaL family protein [Clostridium moniliforme]MBP1890576.1 hypothetical protein [Clostridium moniliforme]
MGKFFSFNYFRSIICNKDESNKIIRAIEETNKEIEVAKSIFDNVDDSLLIEAAIYKEEAAKKRYSYLINEARKKSIKVNRKYIINI